jgi:hypothetical protein
LGDTPECMSVPCSPLPCPVTFLCDVDLDRERQELNILGSYITWWEKNDLRCKENRVLILPVQLSSTHLAWLGFSFLIYKIELFI